MYNVLGGKIKLLNLLNKYDIFYTKPQKIVCFLLVCYTYIDVIVSLKKNKRQNIGLTTQRDKISIRNGDQRPYKKTGQHLKAK